MIPIGSRLFGYPVDLGVSVEWRGEVVKTCDVLIKSHDWRSVVNEKERNGWEERRIGCV
jgi:hypothetical protein